MKKKTSKFIMKSKPKKPTRIQYNRRYTIDSYSVGALISELETFPSDATVSSEEYDEIVVRYIELESDDALEARMVKYRAKLKEYEKWAKPHKTEITEYTTKRNKTKKTQLAAKRKKLEKQLGSIDADLKDL